MSRPTYTATLRKVTDRLKPTLINIIDDSAKHASHAPMRGSDRLETHFRVEVVSDGFKGLNRVQRQKLMYSILSEEMDSNPGGTVHALSMSCKTPDEVIPIEAERVTCFHVVPAREGAAFNVTVGYRSGVVETFDLVLLAEATARRFATGPSLDLRPVLKGRRMHQATVVFSYRSFLFIGYEGLGLYWVAILRPSKYPKPRELVFTADSIGKVPTDIGDARLWETASSHGGGLVVIAITSDWSPDKFTNNGRLSLRSGLEYSGEAYRFALPELAYAMTAIPTITPSSAERGEPVRVAVSLCSSPSARSAAQGFHHRQLGSVKTSAPVSGLAWSPDRDRTAGVSDDGILKVWAYESGKLNGGRHGLSSGLSLENVIGRGDQVELECVVWLDGRRIVVVGGGGDAMVLLDYHPPRGLRVLHKCR
ncbi:hypothetical protein FOZ60_010124 [Perkinsus olseni]|uniref:BolA-like protein 1 n=1 Tax=Perkinsus olseni TaxID=32597 RepID=A0A7J6PD83_PEROL|nr:hypothetical protein FOZ60_010124 [Perkinsus olseni]